MPQDYVVRIIQQLAAMLAGIIAQRELGQLTAASDSIEQKCLEHVGLPLAVVRQVTADTLSELLAAGGDLRFFRSIALAELLIQDAELSVLRGSPFTALTNYSHVFRLLSDSLPVLDSAEQEHYEAKLADVATKLRDLGVDPTRDLRSTHAAPAARDAGINRPHQEE